MNRAVFAIFFAALAIIPPSWSGGVLADAATDEARVERQRLELLRLQKARKKVSVPQSRRSRRRRSSRPGPTGDHLLVPVPAGWVTVDHGADTGSIFTGWLAYRTGAVFHRLASQAGTDEGEVIRVEQFRKASAPGPSIEEAFQLWKQYVSAACEHPQPVTRVASSQDGRPVLEGLQVCTKVTGQNSGSVSMIKVIDGASGIHVIIRQAPGAGDGWTNWFAKVGLDGKTATAKSRILPVRFFGFFVSRQGHVLATHTRTKDCRRVQFLKTKATLLASDPVRNLALLKLEAEPKVIGIFRGGAQAGVGAPVAIQSGDKTLEISALIGPGGDPKFVTLSTPTPPGNSGLVLVDLSGRVAGMALDDADIKKTLGSTLPIGDLSGYALGPRTLREFLEGQGIAYEIAPPSKTFTPEQATEKAREITVLMECWK
ncbi:MAG: trypsin-like peptidase domain-containing protein [Rhodospirillales bacterium]|nr:trypsin-like peptidase domain-containing protein [Rhodospirillales bacterium]